MSIDARRRTAAAGFVALLALALFWPEPALTINAACCQAHLPVDDLSFLGREAPSWDVVFWCVAGIYAIALLQAFSWRRSDFRDAWSVVRNARLTRLRRGPLAISTAAAIGAVAATWLTLDHRVTAVAEKIDSPAVENVIRLFNRLGGGMNPPLIIAFFIVAGVVSRHRRWVVYGVSMALAGAAAGLVAQAIKFAVGRIRPELWIGPFVRAVHGATSFPSGHTVGAFALGGVVIFASRNQPFRIVAFLLACAVGFARILAFRHWASDVLASALLGLFAAYVASRSVSEVTKEAAGPP